MRSELLAACAVATWATACIPDAERQASTRFCETACCAEARDTACRIDCVERYADVSDECKAEVEPLSCEEMAARILPTCGDDPFSTDPDAPIELPTNRVRSAQLAFGDEHYYAFTPRAGDTVTFFIQSTAGIEICFLGTTNCCRGGEGCAVSGTSVDGQPLVVEVDNFTTGAAPRYEIYVSR